MKHQMSIQSIKIKIGNETKELTIKEAKALKDALDELFPSKTWKSYCTVSQTGAEVTEQ